MNNVAELGLDTWGKLYSKLVIKYIKPVYLNTKCVKKHNKINALFLGVYKNHYVYGK